MDSHDLLIEAVGRVKDTVHHVVEGLGVDDLAYRPDPEANSIAWLVWHLARIQDDHVADVAGTEQVWVSGGWSDRCDLPFAEDATGWGQSSDEVAAVRVEGALLDGLLRRRARTDARVLRDDRRRRPRPGRRRLAGTHRSRSGSGSSASSTTTSRTARKPPMFEAWSSADPADQSGALPRTRARPARRAASWNERHHGDQATSRHRRRRVRRHRRSPGALRRAGRRDDRRQEQLPHLLAAPVPSRDRRPRARRHRTEPARHRAGRPQRRGAVRRGDRHRLRPARGDRRRRADAPVRHAHPRGGRGEQRLRRPGSRRARHPAQDARRRDPRSAAPSSVSSRRPTPTRRSSPTAASRSWSPGADRPGSSSAARSRSCSRRSWRRTSSTSTSAAPGSCSSR